MRDLVKAYDGKLPKGPGPNYGKYISYLQEQEHGLSIDYWTNYLQDAIPCVLPNMNYRVLNGEAHREIKRLDLEMENLAKLQRFCAQEGITISNMFQLAWGLTLRCFIKTDDVSFGYLSAGRDVALDDIEDAVGPYINMMICRMVLGGVKTLREELQSLLASFVKSHAHQYAPLGQILGALKQPGPLFNTLISVRRPSSDGVTDASPLRLKNIWEVDPTEYNLSANIYVSSASIHISMSYWTDVCSDEQAACFASTLQKALNTISEHTDSTPSQLDLFSERNYSQVQKLNANAPQRVEQCAHHLVDQQTKVQPLAPAVCAWDGDFTYGELDHLASQWAAHLAQYGAGPEKLIPVHFEKSKWAVVAILAVVKAGAAFVLLDSSFPLNRLRDICEDIQATILISSEALFGVSTQLASSVTVIGDSTRSPGTRFEPLVPSVLPPNALYAVFTSGSTGKPKGVVLEHSSFCTSAKAHGALFSLSTSSRVLQFSSYAFDVSISELLTTLCFGGCICVPSEDERLNDLTGVANRLAINTTFLTASVSRLMEPEQVPNLHTVVLIGEPMSEQELDRWADHCTLINSYGPCECSIYTTVQPHVSRLTDPRDIGYAMQSLLWIVDQNDHNRLAPVGTIGELVIEGPLVGRGYLRNPQKTAEAFIQPPQWRSRFPVSVGGGFYKSGDLVRYGPEGTIHFAGRKDFQVKINGQRLELGEIEHHLRICLGRSIDVLVDVVYFNQPSDHPTLTAFFKSRKARATEASIFMADVPSMIASLKSRLRGSLPQYMVPQVYIQLEDFPAGNTNKIDRAKLREMALMMRQKDMAGESEKKRQPRNEGERKIQRLVANVLNLSLDQVGLDDNFFMLGGDSAYAMKLVSAARAEALHLSVKDILLQPLLEGLVGSENQPEPPDVNSSATPITMHTCGLLDIENAEEFIRETIAPKTAFTADKILYVLPTTEFQADSIRNWPFTYFLVTMHGPLDKMRLRNACKILIERHEIYRTVFVADGPDILQVVLKQVDVPFLEFPTDREKDLSALCERVCRADSDRGVPLGQLLTKFTLFSQEDPNYHILALRLSHAQYDGYCMPLLYTDLAAIYEDRSLELVTNFSTYVRHLNAQGPSKARHFWTETLKGCPHPTSLGRLSLGTADNAHYSLIELTKEVALPSPPTTITIATLMKAAAALLLMQLTSDTDLVFGQVVSGRNIGLAGVESILGVCANTVPIRVQCQPKWTVFDLLQTVQAQHIDALDHETLGLEEIRQNCTEWPEGTQLGCLIQHQNLDLKPKFSLSEVKCTTRVFGGSFERKFLHICTLPRGNRMVVQIFAPSNLLSKAHCERVLDQLCEAAFWLAAHPYHLLSEGRNPFITN
ncbi:unnamed protein product [Penicillium egyptiacum]|uniref:Carrier domain-containing protein n=1 Tax=Penicillium egyptiacum TaxID=1303716 RepID=A0A9W4P944_9EURO|nr:unnamed protein product [Penicillium egyptiacum]